MKKVATFRTLMCLYDEGEDISGLLKHGRFMSEKSAADVYVMDTFVNYDKYVRGLANRKGPKAFGKVHDLDKSRFFNLENYREVRALKSKATKAKKSGICYRFNGEKGCPARNYIYSHKCSSCEQAGHSAIECKLPRKEKSTKKDLSIQKDTLGFRKSMFTSHSDDVMACGDLEWCQDAPSLEVTKCVTAIKDGGTHVGNTSAASSLLNLNFPTPGFSPAGEISAMDCSAEQPSSPCVSAPQISDNLTVFQPFTTPLSHMGRTVDVSYECFLGSSSCSYLLEGVAYQLKPCRFAALLFDNGIPLSESCWELFNYIIDGFPVIDVNDIEP